MRQYFTTFHYRAPIYFVYMMQQVEYRTQSFIEWNDRIFNANEPLSSVMRRQQLVYTKRAKLLVAYGYIFMVLWAIFVYMVGLRNSDTFREWMVTLVLVIFYPVALIFAYVLILVIGNVLFRKGETSRRLQSVASMRSRISGKVIVVAGSYGKTSMKELLLAVLGAHFDVAGSHGNMNTPSAHAVFVRELSGKEQYVIFELGEGEPGDIEQMGKALRPDYAVITGIAPNHLDKYKTIDTLAEDVLSLRLVTPRNRIFYAGDSALLLPYLEQEDKKYDISGGDRWKVENIRIETTRTTFEVVLADKTHIPIDTKYIGRHQVAVVAFVVAFAHELGVPVEEIIHSISLLQPYQHRMQPFGLSGATIIDDTYNGNLEGVLAGLHYLSEIDAPRKWYVTPGLVEQGAETTAVHERIATEIYAVKPDKLVLINTSATKIIHKKLKSLKYNGDISIQHDADYFYRNLDQIVRAGDVVLMQNDWTDNYA